MVLPLNHRQKINHSGSLIIQSVERLADEGGYSCMVRDQDGHSATASTHVSVVGKDFVPYFYYRINATIKTYGF